MCRRCVCEKYYEGDRQKLPHQVTEKHTNTGVRARLRRARPQRERGGSPRQRRLWRRRSRKCGGDGRSGWRPCVSRTDGNWRTWIEKAVWVDFVGSTDWVDFSPPGFGVGELKNWLGGFFSPTDYLGGVASVDSET